MGAQLAGMITRLGVDAAGKAVDFGLYVHRVHRWPMWTTPSTKPNANSRLHWTRAQADLLQDKVKLAQAERDWKRAKTLVPNNAIAQSELS